MARSKDVYAVLGYLCINPTFREQFFKQPQATATKLVGALTEDDVQQINRIAGVLGVKGDREVYVRKLKVVFEGVYKHLRCPHHPCPDDPDPPLA